MSTFAKILIMKRLLAILFIIAALLVAAWKLGFIFKKEDKPAAPKPEGLVVSKHSAGFNESMKVTMDSYYELAESLVNWDTARTTSLLSQFKTSVDSLQIQEMQKDSAIYPTVESQWESIRSEIVGMQLDSSLYEKRVAFNSLSQMLFDLLRIVKYDAAKVYYHECPMALSNYESSAFWLSTNGEMEQRRNPYLGLYDPKYGRSMLKCGNTRDSISFVSATEGK